MLFFCMLRNTLTPIRPSIHSSSLTLAEPAIGQPAHMEGKEAFVPGNPVVFAAAKPFLEQILDT